MANPSVVPVISGKQLLEHALYPAPGCVLNNCLLAAKLLDAIVVVVRDVAVATGINRDSDGVVELPGPRAIAPPHGTKGRRQLAPCCGREQSADDDE